MLPEGLPQSPAVRMGNLLAVRTGFVCFALLESFVFSVAVSGDKRAGAYCSYTWPVPWVLHSCSNNPNTIRLAA